MGNKKVVACIIARTISTRLPLKVLRDLYPNTSMIEFLIDRIKLVKEISEVYICTSQDSRDDIFEDIAIRKNIKLFRGSEDRVIERMLAVGDIENADYLIRITGDNPLTSIEFLPNQIDFIVNQELEYVRVIDVPIGATCEVICAKALHKCYLSMDPDVSEYLMLYIFEPDNYKCGVIKPFENDYSNFSLTVDTPNDLNRTKNIFKYYSNDKLSIQLHEIMDIIVSKEIPDAKYESGSSVKLPYNKIISFEEFSKDMDRRKSNSKLMKLYEH